MSPQQHGAGRMRRRAGIVAAPDRAAHCTAPRRAPTTTTAPGTDRGNKAGAITPRTTLKTVSKQPRRRRSLPGVFSAPRRSGVWRKVPSTDDISRALAALMYSGRPVEGAASGATSGVAVFFFFIQPKCTQGTGRVYCSRLGGEMSALRSAAACGGRDRSLDRGPAHFRRIDPLFQRAAVGTIIHSVRHFSRCKG